MLTGRNHHRVGMGSVAEFPGPYPGYTGTVPRLRAVPQMLKKNGYATGGFGKWHLTPDREQGPAGPVRRTGRTGWGFDHFWGFLSGAAGQWDPT